MECGCTEKLTHFNCDSHGIEEKLEDAPLTSRYPIPDQLLFDPRKPNINYKQMLKSTAKLMAGATIALCIVYLASRDDNLTHYENKPQNALYSVHPDRYK